MVIGASIGLQGPACRGFGHGTCGDLTPLGSHASIALEGGGACVHSRFSKIARSDAMVVECLRARAAPRFLAPARRHRRFPLHFPQNHGRLRRAAAQRSRCSPGAPKLPPSLASPSARHPHANSPRGTVRSCGSWLHARQHVRAARTCVVMRIRCLAETSPVSTCAMVGIATAILITRDTPITINMHVMMCMCMRVHAKCRDAIDCYGYHYHMSRLLL